MFYIYDNDYKDIRNVLPFGLLIKEKDNEKDTEFLSRIKRESEDALVVDIILSLDNSKSNYAETFKDFKIFYPHDSKLEFVRDNIIFPKICQSYSQIACGLAKGYKNFFISACMLSNVWELKKLPKDISLLACPNDAENGNFWIRPEGISQYSDFIKNWVLKKTPNFSETLREYQNKKCTIVSEEERIVGITAEQQCGLGLLPEEFDMLRANCNQRCVGCEKCNRLLQTFNKIPHLKKSALEEVERKISDEKE